MLKRVENRTKILKINKKIIKRLRKMKRAQVKTHQNRPKRVILNLK
jgi:hypothetical protein